MITGVIQAPYAPVLQWERSQSGGSVSLGGIPTVIVLSEPAAGPPLMGVQANDVVTFTQVGEAYVPRGVGVRAGDRCTYQGRVYSAMGAGNWDIDHPLTGTNFGWMTFALQVDPAQLIADLLALRGQQIVLVPAVGVVTEKPSGGKDYAAAAPRAAQTFVLFHTDGLDGREDSQTDRGLSRKSQFQLVGAADAVIAVGDAWEDDVAKYTVESVDRTKPYNVEALVVGFLKVSGHGFG